MSRIPWILSALIASGLIWQRIQIADAQTRMFDAEAALEARAVEIASLEEALAVARRTRAAAASGAREVASAQSHLAEIHPEERARLEAREGTAHGALEDFIVASAVPEGDAEALRELLQEFTAARSAISEDVAAGHLSQDVARDELIDIRESIKDEMSAILGEDGWSALEPRLKAALRQPDEEGRGGGEERGGEAGGGAPEAP